MGNEQAINQNQSNLQRQVPQNQNIPYQVDRFRPQNSKNNNYFPQNNNNDSELNSEFQKKPQKAQHKENHAQNNENELNQEEQKEKNKVELNSKGYNQYNSRIQDKDNIHSVYLPYVPYYQELLKDFQKTAIRTETAIEKMDKNEKQQLIINQLGRLAYLEERIELLQKEISNQVFHLQYKHKNILNFQADYNKLRDETIAHHARIYAFEQQIKVKEMARINDEIEEREEQIRFYIEKIEKQNEMIDYWKHKASIDDNCVSIITSLRFRTHSLMQENQRLQDILYMDEEYADIKSVVYDAKQLQMQQEIFEDADNLLRDAYESGTYDNIMNDKQQAAKQNNDKLATVKKIVTNNSETKGKSTQKN